LFKLNYKEVGTGWPGVGVYLRHGTSVCCQI